MRIAQVAPLYESVPPKAYGGTERVVSYLTEELVRQGHEVTLFASGDSETAARLIPVAERSLRLNEACEDQLVHHVLMLEMVAQRAAEFDVIHSHMDYLAFPMLRRLPAPAVTTLHGKLTIADLVPLYREFHDVPVISISMDQRTPLPWARWLATVYHGLPPDLYPFEPRPADYLAFLGRISPEKRVDRAIEIARAVKMPLKVAAKVDEADRAYYDGEIAQKMDHPLVEFVGEIGDAEKGEFLGKARALLFPIDWPEPFGIVMIEAMACGTPVIAYRAGSVPEVLDEGVTGFIVDSLDEAIGAVRRVPDLSRARCRRTFEERFTAERMARDYLRAYDTLIEDRRRR